MKTANIAYAKAHLSEVVRRVKEGESVLLTERRKPVAMLVPVLPPADGSGEWVDQQIRRGIARPPLTQSDLGELAKLPIRPGRLRRALRREQDAGW